jgi:type III restriction enzyme
MPYVCLRLPTGGGGTLLGAHAVGVARDAWIDAEFPLVLWLVPTNMIRTQTVDALNNPRHPYRAALDDKFGGRVRIYDIGDFGQIRAHDLAGNCCVVVGTLQTLRVESTDGRKVYAHHEELEPLFSQVPRHMAGLETLGADMAAKVGGHPDDIRYSFANLCHLRRPLMIVDEAHKAVTGLSREMQARVNPCAIIEFTATPHRKSNILHSVSAMELKDAQMIKLPVRLEEHGDWESAVTGAILKRAELAEEAAKDRVGYIRPIVLFQAEDKNREVTVEVLRDHLINTHHVDRAAIAVATGDQRGLDGINPFDPACSIEYVIAVEALKEGWDCSFAYVFCSVANIKSATDAEQLLWAYCGCPMPNGANRRCSTRPTPSWCPSRLRKPRTRCATGSWTWALKKARLRPISKPNRARLMMAYGESGGGPDHRRGLPSMPRRRHWLLCKLPRRRRSGSTPPRTPRRPSR